MGLLCDYFAAPSIDDAAATIDRLGGPGSISTPAAPTRRGLFRRQSAPAAAAETSAAFVTVDGGGIEPVVQMGTLEALLTGRSYEEVVDARDGTEFVAVRDEGQRLVVKLSDQLANALARASGEELDAVAEPWAQTEEFWGAAEPALLADFLRRLSVLSRQARDDGAAVYCWMSV